jgi:hypothetical protein
MIFGRVYRKELPISPIHIILEESAEIAVGKQISLLERLMTGEYMSQTI